MTLVVFTCGIFFPDPSLMQTGIGDSNVQLTRVYKKLCVLTLRSKVTVLPHGQQDISVESPQSGNVCFAD